MAEIPHPDAGLAEAIAAAGNRHRLATLLGVSYPAIRKWWRVPSAERALDIERIVGVPKHVTRPDLYTPSKR